MSIFDRPSPADTARTLMREQMVDRVDITPVMDMLQLGLYTPMYSGQVLELEYPQMSADRARAIWIKTKTERNACAALFIGDIWNSYAEERRQVMESILKPTPTSLKGLHGKSAQVFEDAVYTWYEAHERRYADNGKHSSTDDVAYSLLRKIIHFGANNGMSHGDNNPAQFIINGIATSANTMWATIAIVPELARRDNIPITQDDALKVIRGAYGPVVSMFASMNQDVTVRLLKAMLNTDHMTFRPDYFFLKPNADNPPEYSLGLHHEMLMSITDAHGKPILQHVNIGDTTRCPALVAKGEKANVVSELFAWDLELAMRYYSVITQLPKDRPDVT